MPRGRPKNMFAGNTRKDDGHGHHGHTAYRTGAPAHTDAELVATSRTTSVRSPTLRMAGGMHGRSTPCSCLQDERPARQPSNMCSCPGSLAVLHLTMPATPLRGTTRRKGVGAGAPSWPLLLCPVHTQRSSHHDASRRPESRVLPAPAGRPSVRRVEPATPAAARHIPAEACVRACRVQGGVGPGAGTGGVGCQQQVEPAGDGTDAGRRARHGA